VLVVEVVLVALAQSIVAHASHARAKVRQAVAQAAVHLPEAHFEGVIGGSATRTST
jgi:hypothetical protein